ncbi:MAG: diguanylate cyclase [Anaerolineales bacterium]|nr:diguanylate cyclase [Anaerolineales bacterium]
MDQYSIFLALAPFAATCSFAVAVYSWLRREARGALVLSIYMLVISIWISVSSIELLTISSHFTILWAQVGYMLFSIEPILWLMFALRYADHPRWATFPNYLVLWILPVLTILLVLTNDLHGLIWQDISVTAVTPSITAYQAKVMVWFWVNSIYAYGVFIVGVFVIAVEFLKSYRLYREQAGWLLLGSITPLLFQIIYTLNFIPALKMDYSPIIFAFSGAAIGISILRHRLFDIMPVARTTLVDSLQDGMLVLDIHNRVVDINPVARKILGVSSKQAIGASLYEILPMDVNASLHPRDQRYEIELNHSEDGLKNYELNLVELNNNNNVHLGFLVTLHDITERIQLLNHVKELATLDPLTNLYNRRYFADLANKEIERANRYHIHLSLIMIDIDYFKPINDKYGHAVGDQVLKLIAETLNKSIRCTDILARYGGEEFLLLLPETPPQEAAQIANRLCKSLSNTALETGSDSISITISAGVAGTKGGMSLNEMLDHADKALYVAKETGRNRAVLWKEHA